MATLNWRPQVNRNASFTVDQREECHKYLTETSLNDIEYDKAVKQGLITREKLSKKVNHWLLFEEDVLLSGDLCQRFWRGLNSRDRACFQKITSI